MLSRWWAPGNYVQVGAGAMHWPSFILGVQMDDRVRGTVGEVLHVRVLSKPPLGPRLKGEEVKSAPDVPPYGGDASYQGRRSPGTKAVGGVTKLRYFEEVQETVRRTMGSGRSSRGARGPPR